MKKISIILLLFVLAFSQVGSYFVFRYMQHEVKEQMMEKILSHININDTEAITLTGNEQHIVWEEENKEFSYNGDMYDVVRSVTINGKVILYCLNDKKENQLSEKYCAAEKHANESKTKNINSFIALFIEKEPVVTFFNNTKQKSTFPVIISQLSTGTTRILSPPPKDIS